MADERPSLSSILTDDSAKPSLDSIFAPQKNQSTQSLDWSNVPGQALEHLVPSAKRFGANVVQPFIHPVETAQNIGRLGLGVGEELGISPTTGHKQYAEAAWKGLVDRYGGIEQFKHTIAEDPVGFAADISSLFMPLELGATIPGKVGEVSQTVAKVGRMTDPVRLATKPFGIIGEVGGKLTGAGAENISQAYQAGVRGGAAGEAFRENLRGGSEVADEIVPRALMAVEAAAKERSAQYQRGMARVGQNMKPLKFDKIDKAMVDASAMKKVAGKKMSEIVGQTKPFPVEDIQSTLQSALMSFKQHDPALFHTAIGMDQFKQWVGTLRDSLPERSPERNVAERIYGAVRETIIDGDKNYAKVMKDYEIASKQLKEFQKTLSLRAGGTEDTALRKLLSTGRGGVNTNFGRRAQLARELGKRDPTLLPALSGQALHAALPHGLMGAGVPLAGTLQAGHAGLMSLFTPKALAALAATSPRLWGEIAHGAGRLTPRVVGELMRAGKINPEILRAIALSARGAGAGGGNAAQ
jgi:hypothetical protein